MKQKNKQLAYLTYYITDMIYSGVKDYTIMNRNYDMLIASTLNSSLPNESDAGAL